MQDERCEFCGKVYSCEENQHVSNVARLKFIIGEDGRSGSINACIFCLYDMVQSQINKRSVEEQKHLFNRCKELYKSMRQHIIGTIEQFMHGLGGD